LGSQHALDIVADVAKDHAISLGTTCTALGLEGLDLKTLQNRYWKAVVYVIRVVEDGAIV
jgi:hypothetical protein